MNENRIGIAGIEQCAARATCPLGAICGHQENPYDKPLIPVVSEVKNGELLWTNLKRENRVHVIQSGVFVSMGYTEQDDALPFAIFGRGIAIGIAELYASEELSNTYYIRNLIPGKICSLSTSAIKRKLENYPASYGQRVLSCALVNQTSSAFTQTKIVSRQSLYNRIVMLLLHLRDLTGRTGLAQTEFAITHEEIATLISANRVSTTRVLSKMHRDGVIDLGYKSITLYMDKLDQGEKPCKAHTQFMMLKEGTPALQSASRNKYNDKLSNEELYAII